MFELIHKVGIFLLFLAPIVIFHELGHFIFARIFGVKVEVFSFGLGPKLLKFKRGDTEYAFSLIPLGGYVKLFGDDILNPDSVPESERSVAFLHKSKWARFWIVFGGPLANFIFAYVLYVGILMYGEQAYEMRLGEIPQDSILYEEGLRSGDVIRKMNEQPIDDITEVSLAESDLLNTIEVRRDEVAKIIQLKNSISVEKFLDVLGQNPFLRYPIFFNPISKKHYVLSKESLEGGEALDSLDKIFDDFSISQKEYKLYEIGDVKEFAKSLTLKGRPEKVIKWTEGKSFLEVLRALNIFPIELKVAKVVEGYPGKSAGLLEGDFLLGVDGVKLSRFSKLRDHLENRSKGKEIVLRVLRNGEYKNVSVIPKKIEGDTDKEKIRYVVGIHSGAMYVPQKSIQKDGLTAIPAIGKALSKTIKSIGLTFYQYKRLLLGEVSFKHVGGALSIGKVASDTFQIGLLYFLNLMAFISINLGVVNLFPVPVLDGGHIVFLFIELCNGGPISKKKMELAHGLGLSFILLLFIGSMVNDVARMFF